MGAFRAGPRTVTGRLTGLVQGDGPSLSRRVIATLAGLAVWAALLPASALHAAEGARPHVTASPSPGIDRQGEYAAKLLFGLASDDLATGQVESAERVLELLVKRFPSTSWADRARRELAGLYARRLPGRTAGAPLDTSTLNRLGGPRSDWATRVVPAPSAGGTADRSTALELAQSELRDRAGDRIFFASGSALLGARARLALEAQARFLSERADFTVIIEGHADEPGSPAVVTALSNARAMVVRDVLLAGGVAAARISVQAFGASERVADCASASCAAQNRRAVTRIAGRMFAGTTEPAGGMAAAPRSGAGLWHVRPGPGR